jgi:hypothetical protein
LPVLGVGTAQPPTTKVYPEREQGLSGSPQRQLRSLGDTRCSFADEHRCTYGRKLTAPARRPRPGVAFREHALLPRLIAGGDVALPSRVAGRPVDEGRVAARRGRRPGPAWRPARGRTAAHAGPAAERERDR